MEFAQKAVVTDGERFLLVRKSGDDPHNPGRWEFPGGRMKESDDLNEHICREVLEETGYRIEPGPLIDMWSWDMNWNGDPVRVVAVSRFCRLIEAPRVSPRREKDDYIDAQAWYEKSELSSLDVIDSQQATIRLITDRATEDAWLRLVRS
jgi:8-oxo-dGTP pyrophosphatase MutT (NUDIX family)